MGRLLDYLDRNGVRYEVISHRQAFTAQEVAQAEHISGKELAKVVMLRSGKHFSMVVLPAPLRVRVNEAELQQVVLNLLLNAVEACASGGRVSVGAEVTPGERGNGSVVVRVRDDGCGIAPEIQKRIFEPFFSARPGGTGLGLFLSLNFVRRWGGEIRVDSMPGRGSTFEIVLPALGAA